MSGTIQSQYPAGAVATGAEGGPVLPHRISWGAIIAGALVAIAIVSALNVLGAAIGLSTIDVQARETPSAGTLGIAGGIWMLVSSLLGLALGAYVAARLSGTTDREDATLHGAALWATTSLISAMLIGGALSGAAHTATTAVGSAVGGAAQGMGSAVQAAAPSVDPEQMIERARIALSGPSEPARMTTEQRGAEITTLVGRRVADGTLNDGDRRRLNQLVAAEAGISEQEAAARVQAYEAEAQRVARQAEEKARQVADAAAKGASIAAFWLFAAMVLGAGAAVIGARTGVRDVVYLSSRRVV